MTVYKRHVMACDGMPGSQMVFKRVKDFSRYVDYLRNTGIGALETVTLEWSISFGELNAKLEEAPLCLEGPPQQRLD